MSDNRVLFSGECQLITWGQSMQAGAWVKLWIHPEDLHYFQAMQARKGSTPGLRLGTVMVEIGDGETIVEQQPARVEPGATPRPKGYHAPAIGDNAMVAVRWCKSPVFQAWADAHGVCHEVVDENSAKAYLLETCGVVEKYGQAASRKHLDVDEECARLWHERIRVPFRNYLREEGLEP